MAGVKGRSGGRNKKYFTPEVKRATKNMQSRAYYKRNPIKVRARMQRRLLWVKAMRRLNPNRRKKLSAQEARRRRIEQWRRYRLEHPERYIAMRKRMAEKIAKDPKRLALRKRRKEIGDRNYRRRKRKIVYQRQRDWIMKHPEINWAKQYRFYIRKQHPYLSDEQIRKLANGYVAIKKVRTEIMRKAA